MKETEAIRLQTDAAALDSLYAGRGDLAGGEQARDQAKNLRNFQGLEKSQIEQAVVNTSVRGKAQSAAVSG